MSAKNCGTCGAPATASKFCSVCGAPIQRAPAPAPAPAPTPAPTPAAPVAPVPQPAPVPIVPVAPPTYVPPQPQPVYTPPVVYVPPPVYTPARAFRRYEQPDQDQSVHLEVPYPFNQNLHIESVQYGGQNLTEAVRQYVASTGNSKVFHCDNGFWRTYGDPQPGVLKTLMILYDYA